MTDNIINCYELDLKQDIPADLKLAQEQSQSLKDTNKVLTIALVIVGVGLFFVYIYGQFVERETRKNLIKMQRQN